MIPFGFCFGQSMYPTIKNFSFVVIKKQLHYFCNDIVAFEVHEKITVHRIISINDEYFTSKGDNQDTYAYECNVPLRHIKGKVIKIFHCSPFKNKKKLKA